MSEKIIDISDSDPDEDESLFRVNKKKNSDCDSSDASESDEDSFQIPKDFWSAVPTTHAEANRPGMEPDTDLPPAYSREKISREKNTIPACITNLPGYQLRKDNGFSPSTLEQCTLEQLENELYRLKHDHGSSLSEYEQIADEIEDRKMIHQDRKRKERHSEATTTDLSDSIPSPVPDNVARRQQHYEVENDDNSISSNRKHNRFGAYDICDETTSAKSSKTTGLILSDNITRRQQHYEVENDDNSISAKSSNTTGLTLSDNVARRYEVENDDNSISAKSSKNTGLTLSDNVARRQKHYEVENDDNSISSNRKHNRFCANEFCDDTTSAKSSKTTGELSSPFQPNQSSSTFNNGSNLTTYDMMLSDLGDYKSNPNFREIVTIQHEQYGPLPIVLYRTDNRTYAQTRRQAIKHYKRFLKWFKIGGKSNPARSTGIV